MKQFLLSAAIALCASTQVHALDLTKMSDADRAAFRDEVRSYLLENPEVLVEALQVLKDRQSATDAQNDVSLVKSNAAALFNTDADWVGGNKDGDITVVEFMDYRCGYCKKANAEVADLIKSDGNIRFVLKEYPILGEQSDLASRFAIAVHQIGGDDAYIAAHDALMVMRADITDASLQKIASDLKLNPKDISARMASPEVAAVIAANRALGNAMKINGTPAFIVENAMLRGYLPPADMRQIVAEQRKG